MIENIGFYFNAQAVHFCLYELLEKLNSIVCKSLMKTDNQNVFKQIEYVYVFIC